MGIPTTYDYRLVALSVMIAIFASYAALDLAGRVTASRGRARIAWLMGGALAMGSGIWAMHYTGMLALRLPMRVYHHIPTVGLSLLAAVIASWIALFVVCRERSTVLQVTGGSVLMGGGIATMHYTGMAAMRSSAMHHYHQGLWLLSVLLAVVISLAGLHIIFYFRDENRGWKRKAAGALVMGMAIPIMHYTGMAATIFMPTTLAPDLAHATDISTLASGAVILIIAVILAFAILTSLVDRHLSEAQQKYRSIFDNAVVGIFQSTPGGGFQNVNPAMARMFGYESPEEMIAGIPSVARNLFVDAARAQEFGRMLAKLGSMQDFESEALRKDGSKIWVTVTARSVHGNGGVVRFEGMVQNITEHKLMRFQLLQAQKLEAVGQLAAGIAHEINTPAQFVGDNLSFLGDAFGAIKSLVADYERIMTTVTGGLAGGMAAERLEASERLDADYWLKEGPAAIAEAKQGIERVSDLVRAMKEFSRPEITAKTPVDLNQAIANTITVSRNEWKYVADMETDYDSSLPLVCCVPGEFNQVILSLIVNAAHAMQGAAGDGCAGKGKIRVQTRNCGDGAEIRIQDTGGGIPKNIQTRIFDPFFTTKEPGKGTGQGLAIARSVIVDKHKGKLDFETEEGKGTTFIICLPRNDDLGAAQA